MDRATAVAIQQADVEKILMPYLDSTGFPRLPFLLTSHFFFNDFDETVVAVMDRPGQYYFIDAAAEKRYDAKLMVS
jgi:hypothetical protein